MSESEFALGLYLNIPRTDAQRTLVLARSVAHGMSPSATSVYRLMRAAGRPLHECEAEAFQLTINGTKGRT